jgi:precorrin-6B C5,15-methyltransferase / cobalt-precorrin-6B C5,C15-methyltransferase
MSNTMKLDPKEWCPPTVLLVGLGTGRDDLSLRVLGWLEQAEVLAGGERHLATFPEFRGERLLLESSLEQFFERLKQISEQKRTAVLASGDPFYFGIGRRLVAALGPERVMAFPNITSIQALFARLAEAWEEVRVVSLHGGVRSLQPAAWLQVVKAASKVAIFTDPQHHPGWVARQLLEAGMAEYSLIVAENLGLPTENIRSLSLQEAMAGSFSSLNIVVVNGKEATPQIEPDELILGSGHGQPPDLDSLPVFGLPEGAFEHEAGMITKMEVRAVVLAYLQLEPGLVLWDLGAGSGSVSIEAARITRLKEVLAVEKKPGRYEALLRNVKKLGCNEVRAVLGRTLEVIHLWPDPDRVFIGGSGDELPAVLQQVAARLRPGGRVVQTAVSLDTLEKVRSFWRTKPVAIEISQLQVNRPAAIAESVRFGALNPIFIISVWAK